MSCASRSLDANATDIPQYLDRGEVVIPPGTQHNELPLAIVNNTLKSHDISWGTSYKVEACSITNPTIVTDRLCIAFRNEKAHFR